MTHIPQLTRRNFLVSVAAAGGGCVLGFCLPTFGRAATGEEADMR